MIELPEMGCTGFDYSFEVSPSATNCTPSPPPSSFKDILNSIEETVALFTIRVWKGEGITCFFTSGYPELICSEYLDDNIAYIVSGYGVVAGRKAFRFLRENRFKLVWSDDPIPLEEQACFQLLKKYIQEY